MITLRAGDFATRTLGYETQGERSLLVIEAVPRHNRTKQTLGYSRVRAWYDTRIAAYRKARFWNEEGKKVRTVHFTNLLRKGGRFVPSRIRIVDHISGQTTVLDTGSDEQLPCKDTLATQNNLLFPGMY